MSRDVHLDEQCLVLRALRPECTGQLKLYGQYGHTCVTLLRSHLLRFQGLSSVVIRFVTIINLRTLINSRRSFNFLSSLFQRSDSVTVWVYTSNTSSFLECLSRVYVTSSRFGSPHLPVPEVFGRLRWVNTTQLGTSVISMGSRLEVFHGGQLKSIFTFTLGTSLRFLSVLHFVMFTTTSCTYNSCKVCLWRDTRTWFTSFKIEFWLQWVFSYFLCICLYFSTLLYSSSGPL